MKYLFFLGLIFSFGNTYAQKEHLIYNFYGLKENSFEKAFISANIGSKNDLNDSIFLSEYYRENKKAILRNYDIARFQQYMEQLSIVKEKRDQMLNTSFTTILNVFNTCVVLNKELKIKQKQQELEKDRNIKAIQKNIIEYSQKEDITRNDTKRESTYKIKRSIINNKSQNSYDDLLTSDQNWNNQVHAWIQQYGEEKTRELVYQKRKDDKLQSNEVNQIHDTNERIISAVTNNRQQIKIKLRGNLVIAYSNGIDQIGEQKWVPVLPVVSIQKTGAGTLYDNDLAKEFSYTAEIKGMQIYFDL